jgi:hypothetical protein
MGGRLGGRFWLVAAALAAIAFLVGVTGLAAFVTGGADDDDEAARREAERRDFDRHLEAEMRAAVTLRGLPEIEIARRGPGVVIGRVVLHAGLEAEPRPMPGVAVRLVGPESAPGASRDRGPYETLTGPDGAFAFHEVPACVGCVLIVEHEPYRRAVLRGLVVEPHRTTDAGTVVLGAPTQLLGEVVPVRFDVVRGLAGLDSALRGLAVAGGGTVGGLTIRYLPRGR